MGSRGPAGKTKSQKVASGRAKPAIPWVKCPFPARYLRSKGVPCILVTNCERSMATGNQIMPAVVKGNMSIRALTLSFITACLLSTPSPAQTGKTIHELRAQQFDLLPYTAWKTYYACTSGVVRHDLPVPERTDLTPDKTRVPLNATGDTWPGKELPVVFYTETGTPGVWRVYSDHPDGPFGYFVNAGIDESGYPLYDIYWDLRPDLARKFLSPKQTKKRARIQAQLDQEAERIQQMMSSSVFW